VQIPYDAGNVLRIELQNLHENRGLEKAQWWESPHSCGGARLSSRAVRVQLPSSGLSRGVLILRRMQHPDPSLLHGQHLLCGPFKPGFGLSGIMALDVPHPPSKRNKKIRGGVLTQTLSAPAAPRALPQNSITSFGKDDQ
jgi:hypothetical protein